MRYRLRIISGLTKVFIWAAFMLSNTGLICTAQRPNVVLVLSDDHGYSDVDRFLNVLKAAKVADKNGLMTIPKVQLEQGGTVLLEIRKNI